MLDDHLLGLIMVNNCNGKLEEPDSRASVSRSIKTGLVPALERLLEVNSCFNLATVNFERFSTVKGSPTSLLLVRGILREFFAKETKQRKFSRPADDFIYFACIQCGA